MDCHKGDGEQRDELVKIIRENTVQRVVKIFAGDCQPQYHRKP